MITRDRLLFYPFPITANDSHIESPKIYVRRMAKDAATCVLRKLVHRHTFFEIVWLLKDNATFFCDFQSYSLDAGTLAFISPGQVHAWDSDLEKVDGIAIFFSLDLFSLYGRGPQFLQELPFYYTPDLPFLKVEQDKRPIFDHLFTTALDRNLAGGEKRDELLLAYLNVALVEALRLYEAVPKRSPVDASFHLSREFRLAAERYYLERKKVQEYAGMLGVTTNHLVKTVRKTMGMTPGQILRDRLMLEAKRMLVHTPGSIAEIAHELAFNDPSQFGHWFRNIQGDSPGRFRQQFTIPQI
ncbi:MAG: helix-turn-helix domain-containing protein [Planctomycetes bacterium]|nr:helix-turn-helix domain-containing protein [Planctomycetota bacterium]